MGKRKIIQIAVAVSHQSSRADDLFLYALSDDGTVWRKIQAHPGWVQVDTDAITAP
jgi:hypothetical protein